MNNIQNDNYSCFNLRLSNTSTEGNRMLSLPIFVRILFFCSRPGMQGGAVSDILIMLRFWLLKDLPTVSILSNRPFKIYLR